jgi:acetoin:2,6-dichlorophenolindophenol oxidoreductase subunit alpha
VTQADVIQPAELDAIDREVAALIDRAVTEAKEAPLPSAADLLTDVYVKY